MLSCVYHSQAELRVAGLTAWSCGGDIRRFGRGPWRGNLAFVLQTQSHTIYLFICCTRKACSPLTALLGREACTRRRGRLGAGWPLTWASPRRRRSSQWPLCGLGLGAEQAADLVFLLSCCFFSSPGLFCCFKILLTVEFCAAVGS